MSVKFLVLGGGGYFGFLGGGGSADSIFMGARIFLIIYYRRSNSAYSRYLWRFSADFAQKKQGISGTLP